MSAWWVCVLSVSLIPSKRLLTLTCVNVGDTISRRIFQLHIGGGDAPPDALLQQTCRSNPATCHVVFGTALLAMVWSKDLLSLLWLDSAPSSWIHLPDVARWGFQILVNCVWHVRVHGHSHVSSALSKRNPWIRLRRSRTQEGYGQHNVGSSTSGQA